MERVKIKTKIFKKGKKCYIADKGKKSIFVKDLEDKTEAMYDICDHYEGEPHLGPNSIVIDDSGSN